MHLLASLSCAVWLGFALCGAAQAQAVLEGENKTLYFESLALPRQVSACKARIPGYFADFDSAFAAWAAARQPRIASGEAEARAEARRNGQSFDRDVDALLQVVGPQWDTVSMPILKENCEIIRTRVQGNTSNGG